MDNSKTDEYIRIYLPSQYLGLYRHILGLLADYGEDMIKGCTCPCKDKKNYIIECYNMFNAAIAAYEIGKAKLAQLLINYIKAVLKYEDTEDIPISPSPEPQPTPTTDTYWYVGQITKTRPEFATLSATQLLENAEQYNTNQKLIEFIINNSCWYAIVPHGVIVERATYISGGIESVATQYDIENGFFTNVFHDDIVVDGITYHIYGNRGSSLVNSNTPATFKIK